MYLLKSRVLSLPRSKCTLNFINKNLINYFSTKGTDDKKTKNKGIKKTTSNNSDKKFTQSNTLKKEIEDLAKFIETAEESKK